MLVLLGLWFSPLSEAEYDRALSQGEEKLTNLEFNRARAYFGLAGIIRPWRKLPKERLELANAMEQDIETGEEFLKEIKDQKVLPYIALSKKEGDFSELVANSQTLIKAGFFSLAIRPLEKAKEKNPNRDIYILSAQAFYLNNQDFKAKENLRSALEIDPLDKEALSLASVIFEGQEKETAVKRLDALKLIEANPL